MVSSLLFSGIRTVKSLALGQALGEVGHNRVIKLRCVYLPTDTRPRTPAAELPVGAALPRCASDIGIIFKPAVEVQSSLAACSLSLAFSLLPLNCLALRMNSQTVQFVPKQLAAFLSDF